ncbi:hypothetical protein [Parapedobacter sp. 10938]|uniref:hypothetical protein n=1 Tax=Parapedobacter flavus TaxID=3110225 RepID=UPI002DB9EC96|nr:hypothetical protein [Parapedobacter sp. 10938]MEC3881912.1 hypothetical protein [Parapedobacter sp. 10938]
MKTTNYFMAIAAAAVAIGSVAFKATEPKLNSEWYEVEKIEQTDPPIPSNLLITDAIGTPSGSCDPAKFTDTCAVLLDLTQFTGSTPEGMTVEEATNAINQAQVDPASGGNNDGYARRQ